MLNYTGILGASFLLFAVVTPKIADSGPKIIKIRTLEAWILFSKYN